MSLSLGHPRPVCYCVVLVAHAPRAVNPTQTPHQHHHLAALAATYRTILYSPNLEKPLFSYSCPASDYMIRSCSSCMTVIALLTFLTSTISKLLRKSSGNSNFGNSSVVYINYLLFCNNNNPLTLGYEDEPFSDCNN